MTLAEKLKTVRKQTGMSQEQLAEKLHVSRQAITKWETGGGTPDIENLKAISQLFEISIDELVTGEIPEYESEDYLYESITEYDVVEPKKFDIHLGGAHQLVLVGKNSGKLQVRLASNMLTKIADLYRVRIDDTRRRIDVDLIRRDGVTEAESKEFLTVFITLPAPYLNRVEIAEQAAELTVRQLICEEDEIDGKSRTLVLDGFEGTLEMNCNTDLDIECRTLNGDIQLNQISASSKLTLPKDLAISARAKGVHTSLGFEESGHKVESFATPDAEYCIELNGMNSELIICRSEFV
ncbi:MAG: helix-turn-helix transcriptional regulator [Eggerthellaceae bacterium]